MALTKSRKKNKPPTPLATSANCVVVVPPPPEKKKRGPRKKEVPPEKLRVKLKHRRSRANARERTRMNRLNDALDRLRLICPVYGGATSLPLSQEQQQIPTSTNDQERAFDFSSILPNRNSSPHDDDDELAQRNAIAMFQSQRLSKIDTLRLARNYIQTLTLVLNDGKQPDPVEYARMLCEGLSQQTTNMICGGLRVSPNLVIWPDVMMDVNGMMMYHHHQYDCCWGDGRLSLPPPPPPPLPSLSSQQFWHQQRQSSMDFHQPPPPPPTSAARSSAGGGWNLTEWQQAAANFYHQQQQNFEQPLLLRK